METLKKLSLFWDVDLAKIIPVTHADFIISRVLDKGDMEDVNWAVDFYGKDKLLEVFQRSISRLTSKSVNFWCLYFNLDKEECIRKQSTKKLSPFWQR